MKKAVFALATAATIAVAASAVPSPAEAGWRGGGWGPGLAGGLIAGAVIGGIASNAYAYGPGYGYYGGPGYGYDGGYAPAYYGGYPADYGYGYAPAYYGGYRTISLRSWVPPRHSSHLRIRRPSLLSRVSRSLVIVSSRDDERVADKFGGLFILSAAQSRNVSCRVGPA